jgi:polyphosphate glucokinase
MKVLGIDIGGSAIKGAPVETRTGRLLAERLRIETPEPLTPPAMGRTLAELARHFKWRGRIGVGFPGVVVHGKTVSAPNLHPRFAGCDSAKRFARATGCRVELLNDADAAGLAEARLGAGRKCRGTLLLLTLGTGVGSALLHDGKLYPNTEFGHLPLHGRSAERFVSTAARKRRKLSWREWGIELGDYVRTLERLLSPELIVVGGGASTKVEKFFPFVRPQARIVPATFHNDAGIIGAALWAAEQR